MFAGCSIPNNSAQGNSQPTPGQHPQTDGQPQGQRMSDRNWTRRSGNFSGNYTNLTPEQRQAMFQQRMQQAVDACQGKGEGAPCSIASLRGGRTGTCNAVNDTLVCSAGMGGRQGPPGRGPPGN